MFEATVIPLTTLPTAHPSAEAVRTRVRVAPAANTRFRKVAPRSAATVAVRSTRR